MSSFDSFRRAIEKVEGRKPKPITNLTPEVMEDDPLTQSTAELPYNPDDILPPAVPVAQQVIGNTAPVIRTPLSAATPAPSMIDKVKDDIRQENQPRGSGTNYDSLTKTQKRMLAFAAIHDAGAALQGNQGTMVRTMLGDFTDRADQERKERQAAMELEAEQLKQAQIQALLMGASFVPQTIDQGGIAPSTEPLSAAALEQKIQALSSQIGAYAGLDQLDAFNANLAMLQQQLEDARAKEAAEKEERTINVGKLNQAQDALVYAERALAASTGLEGEELTEFLDQAKEGNAELDARGFLLTRQSFIPDSFSPAFMDFQAAINTLSAIMTFQNMAEVTAAGARLGILSDSDMRILGNMSGELDPVNKPKQTAQTVMDLYSKINKTIDKLREEAGGDSDELERIRQKYGN